MILGDLILQYRNTHYMSREEFADLAGISTSYVGFLEKGHYPNNPDPINPSKETIAKCAKVMGISSREITDKIYPKEDYAVALYSKETEKIILRFFETHNEKTAADFIAAATRLPDSEIEWLAQTMKKSRKRQITMRNARRYFRFVLWQGSILPYNIVKTLFA